MTQCVRACACDGILKIKLPFLLTAKLDSASRSLVIMVISYFVITTTCNS